MSQLPQPARLSDFMSGMVSDVSDTIAPGNSVALALNMDFDRTLGAMTSRLGRTLVGSQLVDNKNILGLYQHVDPTNASNNLLFAALNVSGNGTATIKNVLTGSDVVTGLTASTKVRFLTYNGETLAINGADAERAWNGSSWITTGGVFDLGDFPTTNDANLVIEFLDRIYVNDLTEPARVHYSGIFSGTAVAWAGDYVDIEPEDQGGKITAFAKVPGYILFFKERSLHRWNFSSAFPESLVQIGTPSQESVVQSGGLVFFYSNSSDDAKGFYVTNGGRPQSISKDTSRTINKFVQAISSSNEADIAAVATDSTILWSVGDLTVDGETYTNVVFRYNRVLNQWSIHSYPTRFMVFANYLVSGVNTRVGGDNDGSVYRVEVPGTYADSGVDIPWRVITQEESFGTNRIKAFFKDIYVRGKNLQNMGINLITNGDYASRKKIGRPSLFQLILSKFGVDNKVEGNTLAVELYGATTNAQAVIKEIEIPGVDVKENYVS